MPVDHTSARILYSLPLIRSGYDRFNQGAWSTNKSCHAYGHVETRSSKCSSQRLDKFARNPKITKANDTLSGQKYVGGLNVSVNCPQRVKICQPRKNLGRV